MKRMIGLAMLVLGAFGFAFSGCSKVEDPWPKGNPKVLVSFPPLQSFALNVAGDDAAVLSVLSSTGPHDYQPRPQDIVKLRKADVFYINGLELDDPFCQRLKDSSGKPSLDVVPLGEAVTHKIRVADLKNVGHVHGEYDPHVWLGIPQAVEMVNKLAADLAERDPPNADKYKKNAAAYVKKLEELKAYGDKAFAGIPKEKRKLIAFHDSLRYLARSFDFEVADVIEVRPGTKPDAVQFKRLLDRVRNDGVRVIAIEPQYAASADSLMEAFKKSSVENVVAVEIDPLETGNPDDLGADFYIKKLKQNIDALAKAWQE